MTSSAVTASSRVTYRNAKVDGLNIFYREAGPAECSHNRPAARLSQLLAHVSQPDPSAG